MLIQIVLTLIIFVFLLHTWAKRARNLLTLGETVSWTLFWLVAVGVLWIPDSTTRIANLLGIGRGADLILYAGLTVLFYMIFRVYVRLEKIERDITKIVRKEAIDEFNRKESGSKPPQPGAQGGGL